MDTPETKLTVETTDAAYQPDSLLSFNHANREVLRITQDGRLIIGEGLSVDGATQVAAKMLIDAFDEQIQKMLDASAAAELVTMNVPRREKAEADTARLDWLQSSINLHVNSIALRGDIRDAIDKAMKGASK
jgi:Glu-tRNA(Gln) amidotransferase subunit E-like FAD-binding protein